MNRTAQTLEKLFDNPTLQALNAFAKKQGVKLYLVGGSVRDLLLERQTTDMDFTLASDAIQFAKTFAANIRATCIVLEENPPTARVIVKQDRISQTPQLSMDFAQFRAASLTDDLYLRDLTINAMAILFQNTRMLTNDEDKHNALQVIDPCGGMKDLERSILQFPSKQVIIADPVRLLRIYRFAAQLDFEISDRASDLVTEYQSMLSNVAVERCREELMKIFNVKKAHPYLQQMEASGLLTQVIPAIKETRILWNSLKTFEEKPIPTTLYAYRTEINDYLQRKLGTAISRRSLIKFSIIFGDNLGDIGEHLRFSRKSVRFMECLTSGSKILKKADRQFAQEQVIQFLRAYASDWWGILLYAAASYPIDSVILKRIADTYYEHVLPIQKQGRLITGNDLIQTFHLTEGKQIGNLLAEIEERQFNGEIRTREEAFAAVKVLVQKHSG